MEREEYVNATHRRIGELPYLAALNQDLVVERFGDLIIVRPE
jgi:hypothetical protein